MVVFLKSDLQKPVGHKVYPTMYELVIMKFHYVLESIKGYMWTGDLPVVKISPEWVTGPEQGKSSGRTATFSLWTGIFRDGISSIPGETVIPPWLSSNFLVCENRIYHEKVGMAVG